MIPGWHEFEASPVRCINCQHCAELLEIEAGIYEKYGYCCTVRFQDQNRIIKINKDDLPCIEFLPVENVKEKEILHWDM